MTFVFILCSFSHVYDGSVNGYIAYASSQIATQYVPAPPATDASQLAYSINEMTNNFDLGLDLFCSKKSKCFDSVCRR